MGNLTILQTTGISMCIDSIIFWSNLYLSKHESDFMIELLKKTSLLEFSWIYNFSARNDGGEFQTSYKEVYPKGLVESLKHFEFCASFTI